MTFEELLDRSMAYTFERQERFCRRHDLNTWKHFEYDQHTGSITVMADDVRGIVADMHAVGSISYTGGTWLWSWGNPWVLHRVKHRMSLVRDFGEQHGLVKLTEPEWPATTRDGLEMTAIAAHLLEAEGAFLAPTDRGDLFVVLENVQSLGSLSVS